MKTCTREEVEAAFRSAGIDPDLHGSLADVGVAMAAVARDVLDRAFGPQDQPPSRNEEGTVTMPSTAPVPPPPFAEAQQVNVMLTVSGAVLSDDGAEMIYIELEDGRRMDVPRSAVTLPEGHR